MKSVEFYRCSVCRNIVGLIENGGGTLVCCGKPMDLLKANTSDGAVEKHVPVITKDENGKTVATVGSVPHPMLPEHYIQWIALVEDNKTTRISLEPGEDPKAVFCGKAKGEVYEYCNLHGLWKTNIPE